MLKLNSCLIILLFFCIEKTSAQEDREIGIAFLSEANYEINQNNYSVALKFLNLSEKYLGETNSRILYLKIKTLYELERYNEAKLLINKFKSYESGEGLQEETYKYISKIQVKENELIPENPDIYFAKGKTAFSIKKWAIAEKYLNKALELNYTNEEAVILLHTIFLKTSALNKIEANLLRGVKLHPDNENIINLLINYYIDTNQNGFALNYLNKTIQKKENVKYLYIRGVIYDNKKYFEEAISDYERCLEIDPEYFNAVFNLGVLYFNQGVELVNKNNENAKENIMYRSKSKIANAAFKESLPYFERALMLKPTNKLILESLKNLYKRFGMTHKYEEIEAKLSLLGD